MKANGKTICSMVKEKKLGPMGLSMRVSTSQGRSTASGYIAGMTDRGTKGNGSRTRSEVSELTHGLMEESIRESGSIITWRAWAYILGRMAVGTRGNIKTIRNMAMASTHGPTIDSTKACGSGGNSMVSECTAYQGLIQSAACGRMESV